MTLPAALAVPVMAGTSVLAQPPGNDDPGGQGADFGKSSPVGLLLLLLFLIALVFLIRSMTKHLKRIPESFEGQDQVQDQEQAPDQEQEQDQEQDQEQAPDTAEQQSGQARTASSDVGPPG